MRYLFSLYVLILTAALLHSNSAPKPTLVPASAILDLDDLKAAPNQFCDDEVVGSFEPMVCGPRQKDLRHSPELYVRWI